jgi:hypothetical protein
VPVEERKGANEFVDRGSFIVSVRDRELGPRDEASAKREKEQPKGEKKTLQRRVWRDRRMVCRNDRPRVPLEGRGRCYGCAIWKRVAHEVWDIRQSPARIEPNQYSTTRTFVQKLQRWTNPKSHGKIGEIERTGKR